MTDLAARGPLGLKQPKPAPARRQPMRKVSRKRQAYRASDEGKAARIWMGKVKDLPCVICGHRPPSEAHHVCHGRFGTRKSSDFNTIPLCAAHHRIGPEAIHNGKETWAAKHGPDYGFLNIVRGQIEGPHEVDF